MQWLLTVLGAGSALTNHYCRCTNNSFKENTSAKTLSQLLIPASGYGWYIAAIGGKFRYALIAESLRCILMFKFPNDIIL